MDIVTFFMSLSILWKKGKGSQHQNMTMEVFEARIIH